MATNIPNIQLPTAEDSQIVLYQPDETISLEVKLDADTVWLSQAPLCKLFGKVKSTETAYQSLHHDLERILKCLTSIVGTTAKKIKETKNKAIKTTENK